MKAKQRQMQVLMICLRCTAIEGQRLANGTENWWWRILQRSGVNIGRIGPFCSDTCAHAFTLPANPTTHQTQLTDSRHGLSEYELDHLRFHRHRLRADVDSQNRRDST